MYYFLIVTQVSWASEYGRCYVISVYLVQKLTSDDLLQRLKNKGAKIADFTRSLSEYCRVFCKIQWIFIFYLLIYFLTVIPLFFILGKKKTRNNTLYTLQSNKSSRKMQTVKLQPPLCAAHLCVPLVKCAWCCRAERAPVTISSVSMPHFTCRWMNASQRGRAQCVTRVLFMTIWLLTGRGNSVCMIYIGYCY